MANPRGPFLILGDPAVYDVIPLKKGWEERVEQFVARCEQRNRPAFASLYWFKKADLDKRTVDRETAIVDTIKFDLDGKSHATGVSDPLTQLRKAMDWFDSRGLAYKINFSGSDGFGIELPLPRPVTLDNSYRVVSMMYKVIKEKAGVDFDEQAMLGTQQKFRIVNSRHQRSRLYAIPLTNEQARSLSMAQIKELARQPSETIVECDKAANEALLIVAQRYDDLKEVPKGNSRLEYSAFLPGMKLRPCTQYLIDNRITTWKADNIIAFELIALHVKEKIADDESDRLIHEWSSAVHREYNPVTTQYQIDKLREKIRAGDLFVHGCWAIKDAGFCVNQMADDVDECRESMVEEEKKLKVEKLRKFLARNTGVES